MRLLMASIAIVCIAGLLIIGSDIFSAETSITATVTAEVIALSIPTNSSFNYGTVSSTQDTTASGINKSPVVKNDGSVAEDFKIKGTDSSPSNWELGDSAGNATYAHKECHADCDSTPSWAALNEDDFSSALTDIGVGSSAPFDLQITVPTSNAGTSQENVDVSVNASKHI